MGVTAVILKKFRTVGRQYWMDAKAFYSWLTGDGLICLALVLGAVIGTYVSVQVLF